MNRYEQWVAEGRDYNTGLALLNQVPGMVGLKRLLLQKNNEYTRNKLNVVLSKHLHKYPSTGEPKGTASAPPLLRPLKKPDAPKQSGPERPFSTSKFEALPFEELPPELQKARIVNNERYQERRKIHERLKAGITDKAERSNAARRIVELSDQITAAWQIEDAYKETGAVPIDSETELRQQFDGKTIAQLKRMRTMRINRGIKRAKDKIKATDPEDKSTLAKYNMRLGRFQRELAIVNEMIAARE